VLRRDARLGEDAARPDRTSATAGEIRAFRASSSRPAASPTAPILFTFGTDPMLDQRLRLVASWTLVER